MEKDLDTIKKILDVFIEADTALVKLIELDPRSPEEFMSDDKFLFHFLLMIEEGLITNAQLETGFKKLGLSYTRNGYEYTNPHLRLSNEGHELALALRQATIFEKLKTVSSSASMSVLQVTGKKLLQ